MRQEGQGRQGETRGQGNKGTRGQGDKEDKGTRGQGRKFNHAIPQINLDALLELILADSPAIACLSF